MNFTDLTFIWVGWMSIAALLTLGICTLRGWWRYHRGLGGMVVAMYIVSFPLLLTSHIRPWFGLLLFISTLYLVINAARLWMNRFHEAFLRRGVQLNAALLNSFVLLLFVGSESIRAGWWHPSVHHVIGFLMSLSMVLGAFMLLRVLGDIRRYQPAPAQPLRHRKDLPTVTLAIPARNETHALEESLSLAIKSDYPKLEILVLDDCSQDATAAVIRGFAQDGVRFVQGKVPAEDWLGKNYACSTLAEEASGDIIIFASVDTHFDPQSISHIVNYTVQHQVEMLSVLPYRRNLDIVPIFFEQLRNFWQIVLPISRRHVPISSPCWAIWSDSLRRLGGFGAYKNSVFPEVHFAQALRQKRSYRFVLSGLYLGVTTRKHISSQLETATRTFYPFLKRRPAFTLLASLLLVIALLLPYLVCGWQLLHQTITSTTVLAGLAIIFLTCAHIAVLVKTTPTGWWVGFVNFPVLVILEVLLYNWSMLQFEFGEVNWKGRNVCYPIMETIPMEKFTRQL